MLTLAKIRVYRKYLGDNDAWVRSGTADDRRILSDAEWSEIEALRLKVFLLKHGKASTTYAAGIREELERRIEGAEAIRELFEEA